TSAEERIELSMRLVERRNALSTNELESIPAGVVGTMLVYAQLYDYLNTPVGDLVDVSSNLSYRIVAKPAGANSASFLIKPSSQHAENDFAGHLQGLYTIEAFGVIQGKNLSASKNVQVVSPEVILNWIASTTAPAVSLDYHCTAAIPVTPTYGKVSFMGDTLTSFKALQIKSNCQTVDITTEANLILEVQGPASSSWSTKTSSFAVQASKRIVTEEFASGSKLRFSVDGLLSSNSMFFEVRSRSFSVGLSDYTRAYNGPALACDLLDPRPLTSSSSPSVPSTPGFYTTLIHTWVNIGGCQLALVTPNTNADFMSKVDFSLPGSPPLVLFDGNVKNKIYMNNAAAQSGVTVKANFDFKYLCHTSDQACLTSAKSSTVAIIAR
ncbi:MAG: hypothetical protein GW917_01955, partial [Bdellovibrionales bacterium]|nr:hypothetical protein [Bdellovibrionales bacterium]